MKKSEARAILGIKYDSSNDELKAAFRDSCKMHHPDVGGSKELFYQAQLAYNRLTNDIIEPEHGMAYSELLTAFNIVIDQVSTPENVDLIYRVKEVINAGISSLNKRNLSLTKDKLKYEQVILRLNCKTSNAVTNMLVSKLEDLESSIDDNSCKIATLELALELLANYSYTFELSGNNFGGMTCQL